MNRSTRGLAALAILCVLAGGPALTGSLTLDGTWQSMASAGAVAGQCGTIITDDGLGGAQAITGATQPVSGTIGRPFGAFTPFPVNLSAPLWVKGIAGTHVVFDGGSCAGGGTFASSGSTGTDASANAPAIPVVGAAFGATGPYANYVLVKTIAASAARLNIDIENPSGAQIVVVRDDGTAAAGAAPANASLFPLGGGASAGVQGGAWSSTTFKGRVQIYAPSSSAQITVMID